MILSLALLIPFQGSSEAKYLVLDLWQGVENHNFDSESNREWILKCIKEKMAERGVADQWTIEWQTRYAGHFPDDGNYSMGETAKEACNWDPNAYILYIIVDECFINHTDFNTWRTGHVDVKDPFVGINCFLYSGSGERVCFEGLSRHFSNKTGPSDPLLDALYLKCFKDVWTNFFDPWLFGPKEEAPKGNYTEDYVNY